MKTTVCGGCGRTIDKEFAFCPWCGENHAKIEKTDYMDVIFQRYTMQRNEYKRQKISSMSKKITDLEKELDVLVLSAEMHK